MYSICCVIECVCKKNYRLNQLTYLKQIYISINLIAASPQCSVNQTLPFPFLLNFSRALYRLVPSRSLHVLGAREAWILRWIEVQRDPSHDTSCVSILSTFQSFLPPKMQ